VDLRTVLASAQEQARALITDKQHRLTTDLPAVAAMIRGDASRLVQVFANLLTNAAKYTPPGGAIVVTLVADGPDWRVSVSDSGEGLDPASIEELFEPFVQAPSAMATNTGLGLGLAIVKRIVDLHGGRVSASSDGLGRGARLTVWLAATT